MDAVIKQFDEILAHPIESHRIEQLTRNYKSFYLEISHDKLANYPCDIVLKSLLLTKYLTNKDFISIKTYLNDDLIYSLVNCQRKYDFFQSKIIIAMYQTLRYFKEENNIFLTLLSINKEQNNEVTVAVLSNIVIDMFFRSNKYELVSNYMLNYINDPVQHAIHNYYKGRYYLVSGDYNKAYHFLQGAMIISSDVVFIKYVDKYLIVSLLLRSEINQLGTYLWTYRNRKYYELYECINSGNVYLYEELMEKNKNFYVEDGLYSVLLRLYENVLREGVRKIGLCYKRIMIADMGLILNMEEDDVRFLLDKCINEGFVFGVVEDSIFISETHERKNLNIEARIEDSVSTFNYIKGMMRYPKTKPLAYENIDKNSYAYDFNN